jgi:hypothetical protein
MAFKHGEAWHSTVIIAQYHCLCAVEENFFGLNFFDIQPKELL